LGSSLISPPEADTPNSLARRQVANGVIPAQGQAVRYRRWISKSRRLDCALRSDHDGSSQFEKPNSQALWEKSQ
jgi:hypothetical protein